MNYYSDGYTIKRNPSPIGGGYVVTDANGEIVKEEEILKKGLTNNEAELSGLLAMAWIAKPGDELFIDSMTVFYWGRSGRCKARPDLTPMAKEVKHLVFSKGLVVTWCPREKNKAGIYIENKQYDNWLKK